MKEKLKNKENFKLNMQKAKKEKGITLVALVVTIVVLLILAGVSINAIVGDDGIIKKAQESANLSKESEAKEIINRAVLEFRLTGGYDTLEDFLKIKVSEGTIDSVINNVDGTLNVSKNGYTVTVENKKKSSSGTDSSGDSGENAGDSTGGNTGGSSSGAEGGSDIKVPEEATTETAPYFPDNTFTKKEGTIDTGLVIQDSVGNEYVWVVVPRTTTVYATTGLGKTTFTAEDYASIETDLKNYTSTYRKNTSCTDTYYADTANEGWFADEAAYNTFKNNMLKSVYLNGGFYVGRYEAGIETTGTNRTSNTDKNSDNKYTTPTTAPVSKADAYPYTYVTRTQAKNLAEKVNSGNYTSSLMFGVQWDLVLVFMAKDKTKITSTTVLTSNSKSIGNYNDNLWTITNPNAQYLNNGTFTACSNPFKKKSSSSILLTTGSDSSFSVQNIYDIAGNVWEWTLEKTSDTGTPCADRGGDYNASGSDRTASTRLNLSTTRSDRYFGFRVSIW